MSWITLGGYRGWTIKWESRDHRMFATTGSWLGRQHDFVERPADRATAFAVAKAWIDGR